MCTDTAKQFSEVFVPSFFPTTVRTFHQCVNILVSLCILLPLFYLSGFVFQTNMLLFYHCAYKERYMPVVHFQFYRTISQVFLLFRKRDNLKYEVVTRVNCQENQSHKFL